MPRILRRKILYIPGFDPVPPRRYRELYRQEGAAQSGISGYQLQLRPQAKRRHFGWRVAGQFADGTAEADFEVLVWADLVQGSMQRGIWGTYVQLISTAWTYIGTGALLRLMRLRRGPVIAALYPVVILIVQALIGLGAALICGIIATRLVGLWAGLPAAALVFCAILWGFRRIDNKLFAYYLMHDYAFTAQHQGAYPAVLEDRLKEFSERLAAAMAEEPDEVLVIGHSSGAYLAVSLLADYLRTSGRPGPALALLTLGHVVPMASFLPKADRLWDDLAFLSERPDIFWLDVTAPGDACCFALCDPVAVTGVAGPDQQWPLVISAAFNQTLSPQRQKTMRWRWFRRHFQYLCAFDRPGDYDYFAITAGPLLLSERFADRAASPSRITRAVGPGKRR